MKVFSKILTALLFAGMLVWEFFVARYLILSGMNGWILALLTVLSICISLAVGITLHELGHLVLGIIGGMEFKSINLPFISVTKITKGKYKLAFSRLEGFLGACEMYPNGKTSPRRAFAMQSLGGPIGSLIWLLIGCLILALTPYISGYLVVLLGMGTFISLDFFLRNALPSVSNGAKSDGAQLLDIYKNTPSSKVLIAVLTAQSAYRRGLTPSQLPLELFYDLPQLPEDDPNYVFLLNNRYLYALDSLDIGMMSDVDRRLRSILPIVPDIYAEQINCDIFFDAFFVDKDLTFLKANLTAVMKYLEKNDGVTACRIRAYYYFYVGDIPSAFSQMEACRNFAASYPIKGIAKMEVNLINHLERMIAEQMK